MDNNKISDNAKHKKKTKTKQKKNEKNRESIEFDWASANTVAGTTTYSCWFVFASIVVVVVFVVTM